MDREILDNKLTEILSDSKKIEEFHLEQLDLEMKN